MLISERIFELIKEKGITQKEFSIRTNIPQSTVSDWKSKRLNPSSDKLLIICKVLGTNPNDLLSEADSEGISWDFAGVKNSKDEQLLLEAFRKMDDKSKERIIQYVKNLSNM